MKAESCGKNKLNFFVNTNLIVIQFLTWLELMFGSTWANFLLKLSSTPFVNISPAKRPLYLMQDVFVGIRLSDWFTI